MAEKLSLDAAVLGQILLIQSPLQTAVTEEQLSRAVCHGSSGVPGVAQCTVCLEGLILASTVSGQTGPSACPHFQESCRLPMGIPPVCPFNRDGSTLRIAFATDRHVYGGLILEVVDRDRYAPYEPFVINTAHSVALHLENHRQAAELSALNDDLEAAVASRIRDLEEKMVRLELTLHAGRFGAWEWRIADGALHWVEHTESIFARKPRTFPETFSAYIERIPETDRHQVENKIRHFLALGNPDKRLHIEHPLMHPSGRIQWVESWGRLVLNDQGHPERMLGACKDITRRKQAEAALRESEERYRDLVEHSQALICTHDLEGHVLSVNAWAAKLLGYPQEVMLEMNIRDILAPEVRHIAVQYLEDLQRHGAAQGLMAVQTSRGERRVWEYHNTVRTEGLAKPIVRGLAYDITEHKRTETALQMASEKWQTTFDAMTNPVVLLGPDCSVKQCNRAFMAFVDKDVEAVIGQKCFRLIHNTDDHIAGCPVVRMRESLTREEMELSRGDKTYIVAVDPIVAADGRLVGIVHTTRDISERKQVEEQRLRLERQLQQAQKAESLGRMAGAIAHHFNNLLGVVMGNLELVMPELPHGSRFMQNITDAMQASSRAAEISRVMLAYLGQTSGAKEPCNLSELCRETFPLLTASLPKKVHLKTEFAEDVPIILADVAQFRQVLTNLVVNAGEAMGDREGNIIVATAVKEAGDIQLSRYYPSDWKPKEEAYACLSVSDAGAGMDSETLDKAFDPFFSTRFTGRGLGLAVVLGVVKAHEGVVIVESSPDQGAVFRVFLPLTAMKHEPVCQAKSVASAPSGEPILVLLVEDEAMLRTMAQTMLKMLGFEVITAADGVEAVEVFREHRDRVQCVLLDLTMPRMDGWETLAAIRKFRPNLPVILASGYNEAQVMAGYHQERPQAFLHKPYRKAELLEALEAVLQQPIDGVRA
jgi:PAS domain S-box-containing protein